MTIYRVRDRKTPIGEVMDQAGDDSVLLETDDHLSHAILPLDDDLIDYLLERNPDFIEECRAIRERMHAGEVLTHEEAERLLAEGD